MTEPAVRPAVDAASPARRSAVSRFALYPLHLSSGQGELRLVITVTTFATAVDVTLAELRPEAFLPADRESADLLTGEAPQSRPAAFSAR